MDIKTQFVLQSKLSFYHTPKFYEDTNGKSKGSHLKRVQSKKQSIFDDIIKAHSKVPGPGKYSINPEQVIQQHKQSKKNLEIEILKPKQSYLDPLLKRSMSLPSVGKYNIGTKNKIKKYSKQERKNAQCFRPTIFDSMNPDVIETAPGLYQIKNNSSSNNPKYSMSPEHKRKLSLPKIPSPGDYNPIPSSYSTFERKSKDSLNQSEGLKIPTFGRRINQKIREISPGPIYNLSTDWGKSNPLKKQFNIYKSITLPKQQSVYNNSHTTR